MHALSAERIAQVGQDFVTASHRRPNIPKGVYALQSALDEIKANRAKQAAKQKPGRRPKRTYRAARRCRSALLAQALIEHVNGIYQLDSEHCGKTQYRKSGGDFLINWEDGDTPHCWAITDDIDRMGIYTINGDQPLPPREGWEPYYATSPAPTIEYNL